MIPSRSRTCAAALALLCLSSFAAVAADPSCPNATVPLAVLLMPPPKPDSAQTKAELQELQRLQESRTPEQVKHVRDDDRRTLERFLGGIGIKVGSGPSLALHRLESPRAVFEWLVQARDSLVVMPGVEMTPNVLWFHTPGDEMG